MTSYPRQNSNFCLQHCCFELSLVSPLQYLTSTIEHCPFAMQCPHFKSNIQLLQFNIAHSQFNVPISIATWFEHATFLSDFQCLYGVKCDMLATQSNILVFCIPNQYPYFPFKFLRLTCDIRVFQCNVDTRCVCRGAECDMSAAQSNILLSALTFTLE